MSSALLLVVLVAVAYVAAKLAFQWIGRHFLIVSGAEYLLLGILLGPQVSGLLTPGSLRTFIPFMTLALGWMGAMVGIRWYLPGMVRLRGVFYRLAFVQSLATLVIVTGASLLVLQRMFGVTAGYALIPALVLGAIATSSASDAVQLIVLRLGRRSLVVRQIEVAVGMDSLLAIATVSAVFCLNHVGTPLLAREPTGVEWFVISCAVGVVGGTLFHLFLGEERDPDRLFISLAGAIIFVTGAASFLQLSPLLPGMLMGAILANTSRNRQQIEAVLHSVERPLYFVLLLCGGALWSPPDGAWLVPVGIFLVTRMLSKVYVARLAAQLNDMIPVLGPNWGRALIGQGGLAVAIAFNYLIESNSYFPNIIFTAAVVSVLLTDLVSARLMQNVVATSPYEARNSSEVPVAADHPEEPGAESGTESAAEPVAESR